MFGGKKRREREAQIQAAINQQQQEQQQGGEAAAAGHPQAGFPQAGRHESRREKAIDSAIDRAIQHNPALSGNPALASSMHDLLRAAREDPQGFKQRMRDIAASSGATAFTLTPEGLVPLAGQDFPGATGQAVPGDAGAFGGQAGTGVNPPAPGTAPAFGGPAGSGATFQAPPPFGGQQAGPLPTSPAQPAVPSTGNPLDQLDKLAQLHNSGALTDAEFEAEKRRILGG
jgi:putative oligomerization/nucleic acid binding protein